MLGIHNDSAYGKEAASALSDNFDAVVMLTWSNWKTEARSNRYHFATRFARHLPVYFVQKTEPNDSVMEPAGDVPGIQLVHMGEDYGGAQSERLQELLSRQGVKRPLYWIYNPYFVDFVRRFPGAAHIYHGTEDYLGSHTDVAIAEHADLQALLLLLPHIQLVVAVTEQLGERLKQSAAYVGPVLTLRNGCDDAHWRSALPPKPPELAEKLAVYQGGVNARLDYDLLTELADRLPDWKFHLCGNDVSAPSQQWRELKSRENVRALGALHPNDVAALQARSAVGLIPFKQIDLIKISLPLKAYEYVASGLPVVTVPIDELARKPHLFTEARNAAEFAAALEALHPSRWEKESLEMRLKAAKAEGYDHKFEQLQWAIVDSCVDSPKISGGNVSTLQESARPTVKPTSVGAATSPRKRVLVTYSASSTHVQTTIDYLTSLKTYMDADVVFAHVTHDAILDFDLSEFDVVFQSYCARWPFEGYISSHYAKALAEFRGVKVLAVQDEYDRTDFLKRAINDMGFDVVLTCVPDDQIEKVYPSAEFPNVEFVRVLTGYVPEDIDYLARYALPLHQRKTLIGYRGRDIGVKYGRLGYDKLEVGRRMREACEQRDILVDIDWTEDSRIYGRDWFKFLGSVRATLGSESGSNVFDFDGSLEEKLRQLTTELGHPPPFEEFLHLVAEQDASMDMGQISPKFFEAAALRTPLVLLEGRYSDMLRPDEHYIPLRKDYSNIDEVLRRLEDLDELQAMADRTYEHLVASDRFSYATFVKSLDALINRKIGEVGSKTVQPKAIAQPKEFSPAETEHLKVRPTGAPLPRSYFDVQYAQRQTLIYRNEVERLNIVYPEQLKKVTSVYEEQRDSLVAEIRHQHKTYAEELARQAESLNGEITRLNQVYGDEIKRLDTAYGDEIKRLHRVYGDEIKRLGITAQSKRRKFDTDWSRMRRQQIGGARTAVRRALGPGRIQRLKRLITRTPILNSAAIWLYRKTRKHPQS